MLPETLTRRRLLAGMAETPAATALLRVGPSASAGWYSAYANYLEARRQHLDYLDNVLRPAFATRRLPDPFPPHLVQLEREEDALGAAGEVALKQLIAIAAADLETLRTKFGIAYDDVLRHEDADGIIHALLVDLKRLAG